MKWARALGLAFLMGCAWLLQSCAGQPADLKCSLIPCQMQPPATFTAKQQTEFHDCWKREYSGLIRLSTGAMLQRDYDKCVEEAKAAPSPTPSSSTRP